MGICLTRVEYTHRRPRGTEGAGRVNELTASLGACNATRVGFRAKRKGLATTKTRVAVTEPQEIDLHVPEEEIV